MTLRVGIVGAGAIGTEIAAALCAQGAAARLKLSCLFEIQPERRAFVSRRFRGFRFAPTLQSLIAASDVVVEATSAKSAYAVCRQALNGRRSVLALSAAGLFEHWDELRRKAERAGRRIEIPSGAVGGLDAVKAAACGALHSVTLTTRKPPRALAGAPYLARKGIRCEGIQKETLIFSGSARRAALAFPQNINIAATLAAAGLGVTKTKVRIYATPGLTRNVHEVEARGDFGRFTARIENRPSPENPKTSRLAALSALACLKQMASGLRIGS